MSRKLRVTLTYAVVMVWPLLCAYLYADLLATEWVAVSLRQFVGFVSFAACPAILIVLYNVWAATPKDEA